MIDREELIKLLRSWLKQRTVLDTKDPLVKKILQQSTDRIEEDGKRIAELEKSIKNFLSGDYPHPKSYRPNQCPHDKHHWEDCGDCDFEYWQSQGFE